MFCLEEETLDRPEHWGLQGLGCPDTVLGPERVGGATDHPEKRKKREQSLWKDLSPHLFREYDHRSEVASRGPWSAQRATQAPTQRC